MFRHILLPIDLSDRHESALKQGNLVAAGGRVTLLHVIEVIAGLPIDEDKAFYRRLELQASAHLATLATRLEGRDVVCKNADSVRAPRSGGLALRPR